MVLLTGKKARDSAKKEGYHRNLRKEKEGINCPVSLCKNHVGIGREEEKCCAK